MIRRVGGEYEFNVLLAHGEQVGALVVGSWAGDVTGEAGGGKGLKRSGLLVGFEMEEGGLGEHEEMPLPFELLVAGQRCPHVQLAGVHVVGIFYKSVGGEQ